MKRINSSYKLIEFLSSKGSGADTIVNVVTGEVRYGAVVLIKKLVFNVAYEKIGVAGSHFGTHGHTIVPVCAERPKMRGRPPKHFHPLLQKEKELASTVERILPKAVAETFIQNGSRLVHLYGLPKTHKRQVPMRPILQATGTYNNKLAKWLDEKLKPLSVNDHTINDVFSFVDALHDMEVDDHS